MLVYPPNLLTNLKTLAGESGFGVFDLQNEIKPALSNAAVNFVDLEIAEWKNFTGQFAIVGPFTNTMVTEQMEAFVRKGGAVIWIPLATNALGVLKPSFEVKSHGRGTLVVVHAADLVANLTDHPPRPT